VGSIGVTGSYLDQTGANARDGYSYVELAAGKYKESGSPDRKLTADERALLMRDIQILHRNFIEDVAANRGLATEAVEKIADGSSVLGARAKELGLIDEVGGLREAEAWIAGQTGAEPVVCW
jgi:protease-4